jgi:hypothetical protein
MWAKCHGHIRIDPKKRNEPVGFTSDTGTFLVFDLAVLGCGHVKVIEPFVQTLNQQVIVGPQTEDGPWYFSLNNRRLWVLKRCREEGLLDKNQIRVRVRAPKSSAEASRYSLENCALEAKMMKESAPSGKHREDTKESDSEAPATPGLDLGEEFKPQPLLSLQGDDDANADANDTSDSDESDDFRFSNPFSALS